MKKIVALALAIAMSSLPLFAQATASSSLLGTVFDASHAVVPGAEVTLLSPTTGLKRVEMSGEEGIFRFNQIPAGTYRVSVKKAGFSTAVFETVDVQVSTAAELNVTVAAGMQTETVNVVDEAPLIDTGKTDVSLSITPTEVQNLPLNGRDFANLAFLAPGAKPVNSYDPTKNRIAVFGVNGSAGRNVNVTVNGIDDKDNTVGGPVMQLPLEAVQEFNISTQRFSAANGRSEGAAINLITKSGTNNYHGSLFLFERDTSLDANDYFSKQNGSPTPDYSRQQYGGSFGGPIVKDKTFAFFALERQREVSVLSVGANAFAQLTLAKPLGAIPATTIPTPYNDQRYNGRLDHRFSESESMTVSYSNQENTGLNDQASSTNDLSAGNFTTNRLILANVALSSVITPSIVNTATFGYQYWNNLIDAKTSSPYISFPSAAFGTNPNVPQQSVQKKWQFRDDVAINRGKHTFKTGFDYVGIPKLGGFFNTPSTLNVTFNQDPSTILGNTTLYPLGFATPGLVTAMSASAGDSHFDDKDAKMFGIYFQDDWKLSSRLNLNLGLRWDKDFNLQGGNVQSLDRTYLALKAINSPYAGGLPKNDNADFSPRVGFAYDITGKGKQILRGGYGIYYGQTFQNLPLFMEQQTNADSLFTQVLQLSSTGPGDTKASIVPGTNIQLSNYRFGIDPLPVIPAAAKTLSAGAVGRLVNPNFHNPYNQEFNLGYSIQLSRNDLIEVEGIHSLALREAKRININPTRYTTGAKDLDAAFVAAGLPKLAQVIVESSVGRSRYDALNISYKRMMTRHFSINTNYVFSRALAYAGGPAAFGNVAMNPDRIFDPAELANAPNDERHRWVFSGFGELPWGIKIAPIMQLATGRAWNGAEGTDAYGYGSGNGTARIVYPTGTTNYTATKAYTAAQLRSGLADGSLSYLPYDFFRGNAFFQLDLRVSKTFKIGERNRVELIAQMFNMSNRANFGTSYTTSIKSSSFGLPSNFLSTSGTVVPHAFQAEMGFRYSF